MNIDKKIQEQIEKINSGNLNVDLNSLNNKDFGLYLPIFVEGNEVKPMMAGYTETERDLVVSVLKNEDITIDDAKPIAWFGNKNGKDKICNHPKERLCKHCTGHTGPEKNCTHPKGKKIEGFDAPELDYDNVIKEVDDKEELLNKLSKENLGITLLHGHSDKFMFTKLPENFISVVKDGETSFIKEQDIIEKENFVPNMWRIIDGKTKIAGGYLLSEK